MFSGGIKRDQWHEVGSVNYNFREFPEFVEISCCDKLMERSFAKRNPCNIWDNVFNNGLSKVF